MDLVGNPHVFMALCHSEKIIACYFNTVVKSNEYGFRKQRLEYKSGVSVIELQL